jgi:hypothetical protein
VKRNARNPELGKNIILKGNCAKTTGRNFVRKNEKYSIKLAIV